jgi:hypothetical protein
MNHDEMDMLIIQTINGAVSTIPNYIDDVIQNQDVLQVKNPQEFVYGMVIGMVLGMSGAVLSAHEEIPTTEDQIKIRDMIYKHIPEIRERIFN